VVRKRRLRYCVSGEASQMKRLRYCGALSGTPYLRRPWPLRRQSSVVTLKPVTRSAGGRENLRGQTTKKCGKYRAKSRRMPLARARMKAER
jgi:hypothetical protein